jgi:peptidoglycan/LPS O-acetylase OafA/YrhL
LSGNHTSKDPTSKNQTLQGLRGLAMLAVFCYHLHGAAQTAGIWVGLAPGGVPHYVLQMCRLSVDVFFMLSGYLIPFCLVRQGSARRFLTNRAARIYPTFLPPHLLLFIVGPLIGYKWMAGLTAGEYAAHFLSNLLFLPGVFDLPIAQLVAWTLSYEIAFYLFAASAMACWNVRAHLPERGANFPGWGRKAPLWCLWLSLAGWALWHHPQGWFFVVGAGVYFLERNRTVSIRRGRWDTWICLAALLVMCAAFDRLFPLSLAAGFVGFRLLVQERGRLSLLLRHGAFQYFGEISFSFYLWHTIVLFPLKRIFAWHGGLLPEPWNLPVFYLATCLGSLAAAHLSWLVIECWLARTGFPLLEAPRLSADLWLARRPTRRPC